MEIAKSKLRDIIGDVEKASHALHAEEQMDTTPAMLYVTTGICEQLPAI